MAGFPNSRRRLLFRGGIVSRWAVGFRVLSLLSLSLSWSSSTTQAQDVSHLDSLLVANVSFVGDSFFPSDQLQLYVQTRGNRRLAGIPKAYWWRWLYSFGKNTLGGGAIGKVFMATGEPPSLLDSSILAAD